MKPFVHKTGKILFAVIAALYVAFEYRLNIHEAKVSQAVKYIERHDQGEIFKANRVLQDFWISENVSEWSSRLQSIDSSEERVKRYIKELPDMIDEVGATTYVYQLLNYYRNVGLCVKTSHCHPETVCSYLFDDIQAYRENYRSLLEDWKENLGDKAPTQVADLVENSCSQQFIAYCQEFPTSQYCPNA